jgi:hypothetical protein
MAGEVGGGNRPGQAVRIESLGRPVTPEDVWNAAIRAGADPARMALSLSHVLGELKYEEVIGGREEEPAAVRYTRSRRVRARPRTLPRLSPWRGSEEDKGQQTDRPKEKQQDNHAARVPLGIRPQHKACHVKRSQPQQIDRPADHEVHSTDRPGHDQRLDDVQPNNGRTDQTGTDDRQMRMVGGFGLYSIGPWDACPELAQRGNVD